MNFTYLVEGPCEPSQEILQQYKFYVVIVVLSEDMSKFVLENIGFELKSDTNALCWLIQPKHFKTAPKGSVLKRLHDFFQSRKLYGHIEHSFIACASYDEVITKTGGLYIPLHLHSEHDDKKRKQIIRSAVNDTLATARPKSSMLNIDRVLSAGSFVATLIGLQ